jgi:hypothetical protein
MQRIDVCCIEEASDELIEDGAKALPVFANIFGTTEVVP